MSFVELLLSILCGVLILSINWLHKSNLVIYKELIAINERQIKMLGESFRIDKEILDCRRFNYNIARKTFSKLPGVAPELYEEFKTSLENWEKMQHTKRNELYSYFNELGYHIDEDYNIVKNTESQET